MGQLFEQMWAKKLPFLGTFFLVFTFSYLALSAFDLLPEPKEIGINNEDESLTSSESLEDKEAISNSNADENESYEDSADPENIFVGEHELPVSLVIDKLGKTIPILNPNSKAISDLDNALLSGAVRHPDSATLSQDGNIFILGHSSYLPKVLNKNFQAFNGIQDLAWGDTIKIYSDDAVYEYRVERVYRAKAQDVTVPIAGTGKMLTLATCNSFGSVDDRYIVEAKQVASSSL